MRRPLPRRLRISSTVLIATLAALGSFAGAAALARVINLPHAGAAHPSAAAERSAATSRKPGAHRPKSTRAPARRRPAAIGPPGRRGKRGVRGLTGKAGPVGQRGPAGTPQVLEQDISINWEGSFANSSGRDTANFTVPGIGEGEVECSQDTQWVHFQPYDNNTDVAMWTAKFQGNDTSVRTARHTTYTGQTFYEGLNQYAGQTTSTGEIIGIISSRGKLGGSNGPGAEPTTFRLSWNWDFSNPNSPYCFMAGTVNSNGD